MRQRVASVWPSTRATAFIPYALSGFLAVSRESEPQGEVIVTPD